jgi:hypothetical protein
MGEEEMWPMDFLINISNQLSIIYKTKNKEIMVSCFGQVGVSVYVHIYKDGRRQVD